MPAEFEIFDVVKSYKKAQPLMLVSAVVVKQTETAWLLRVQANSYGGFRNRSKVPRDAYGRSPEDAWRMFFESELQIAQAFRHQAATREGYASMARAEISRLTADSEAGAARPEGCHVEV